MPPSTTTDYNRLRSTATEETIVRIAIDGDGVITEAPEFFAALTQALRNAGHNVHSVTDFDEHFRDQRERELREMGVEFNVLAITADKVGYCHEHGIDFAIDDDPEYFTEQGRQIPLSLFDLTGDEA